MVMADRFILSHIKRFPLFANLSAQQLEAVANATQVMRYQPGEVVFAQGQPAAGALILVSGQGELTQVGPDGVARRVGVVNAGEYLNESALFGDVIAPVTLRTIETSIALYLSRQQMASVLAYYPDIKNALQARPASTSPSGSPTPTPATPFQGLRENEDVLIETRRHWWAFARRIVITVLLVILMFVFGSLASRVIPDVPWLALVAPVLVMAAGVVAYFYIEWRNDQFLLTERRVINIQRSIIGLSTSINELPLDSILEVNVIVPVTDVLARVFNYGTILIKASGDGNLMKLDYMPNPKHLQQSVFTSRDRIRQNLADENRNAVRNAIRGDIDQFLGRAVDGSIAAGAGESQPTIRPQGESGFLPMKFFNQNGETVYRKHWLIYIRHVFLSVVLILISIVLFAGAAFGASNVGFIGFAAAFAVLAAGVVWFYLADWDWRHDMYVVGDQTITLIHKRPLWLQDENDQVLLSQVDNVISETSGILDTIFQVGDVKISLTGSDAKNAKWFRNVHQPQEIQQEISRRQDRARSLKQEGETQRQKQAIIDYLSVYHETVGGGGAVSAQSNNPTTPLVDGNSPGEQPPRVRDRSRPPGVPLVRRDNPPET
jgi:hypothetical protein